MVFGPILQSAVNLSFFCINPTILGSLHVKELPKDFSALVSTGVAEGSVVGAAGVAGAVFACFWAACFDCPEEHIVKPSVWTEPMISIATNINFHT
jgi:hypothetical protein